MGIYTNKVKEMVKHLPTDCIGYINFLMHTNNIKSIDISCLNLTHKGEKIVKICYVENIGVRIGMEDGFQWSPISVNLDLNSLITILEMVESTK